jgi:hypothetical protein
MTLRDDVPICARTGPDIAARDHVVAVHQPHRRRAIIVLSEDVGLTVVVEIAGTDFMPIRPNLVDMTIKAVK